MAVEAKVTTISARNTASNITTEEGRTVLNQEQNTEEQLTEEQDIKLKAAEETANFLSQIDKMIDHHADCLALFTEQKMTWLQRACMIRGVDAVRTNVGYGMRLYWATVEGEVVRDDDDEPMKEIASLNDILSISLPKQDAEVNGADT